MEVVRGPQGALYGSGATWIPRMLAGGTHQLFQTGETWQNVPLRDKQHPHDLIMELAARYKVSQGTVRKAIDALAAENIVVRRQGRGTFVASHSEPSWQYRFLRLRPDSGERVHPHNFFFGLERGKASPEAAHGLGLKAGTPVVSFKRVMSFVGRPLVLDEIVFAASQFPGFTLAELEEFHGSVYGFYETVFGVRMIRAEERLRAVSADSVAAAHLPVP